MKTTLFVLILTTGLTTYAGGSAEGGGHTRIALSSPEQVTKSLSEAKMKFFEEFRFGSLRSFIDKSGYYGDVSSTVVAGQPARLIQILKELQGRTRGETLYQLLQRDLNDTPFTLKSSGPCVTADGSHTEGAVDMTDPKSPICFSVHLLQQVPASLLQMQVLGLVAHEYMHKLGYGEDDAYLMQMYFIAEVGTGLARTRQQTAWDIVELRSSVKKARAALIQNDASEACRILTDMRKTATGASHTVLDHMWQDREMRARATDMQFDLFNALKIESAANASRSLYGRNVVPEADQAFCSRLASKEQVLEQLSVADGIYKRAYELLPKIFPSGLTVN